MRDEDSVSLVLLDVYPIRIDWKKLSDDLKVLRKLGPVRQARAIGIPWPTFQGYLYRGRTPIFSVGHAFLVLHAKVCGRDLTMARLLEHAHASS